MSFKAAKESLEKDLNAIQEAGLWKTERVIASHQKNKITLEDGAEVINMCANNYLGLANHSEVIQAAKDSFSDWGFGLSSVRFICGTQSIHKKLEYKVSEFLGMEDTILYAACFDAIQGSLKQFCLRTMRLYLMNSTMLQSLMVFVFVRPLDFVISTMI